MAGQIDNRRRAWIREQASIDVNGITDGANTVAAEFDTIEFPKNMREKLERLIATGENEPNAKERGGAMGEITVTWAAKGLSEAIEEGEVAGTIHPNKDFRRMLMSNAFTAEQSINGDGIASVAGAVITVDTNAIAVPRLMSVWESGAKTPSGTEWFRVQAEAVLAHTADRAAAGTYTNAGQLFGSFQWTKPDRPSDQGSYLAMVVEIDGKFWVLSGGRVSSLTLSAPTRGIATFNATITFRKYETQSMDAAYTLSSLPNHTPEPQGALKGLGACIWWNDTEYDYKDFELDFGIRQEVVHSGCDEEGIQEIWNVEFAPVFRFNPMYDDSDWDEGNDNLDTAELMIQLGIGELTGGIANTLAIWFEKGQIDDAALESDNSIFRHAVAIPAYNPSYPTALGGTVRGELFRIAAA
jgi:hypothetical protein